MKIERTKDNGARSKSYVSIPTTKRVCKKKKTANPTNRKGCWGTVIECGGNHIRNKWTIHFDDRTTNKIQDPYGNHKAEESASTTAKSASTTAPSPSQVAD